MAKESFEIWALLSALGNASQSAQGVRLLWCGMHVDFQLAAPPSVEREGPEDWVLGKVLILQRGQKVHCLRAIIHRPGCPFPGSVYCKDVLPGPDVKYTPPVAW